MSSSRSDVVTQCVLPCFRVSVFPFVPFFSFSVLDVLSCSPKEFQWCFKKVLRVFEVSRMFPVGFKGVYKKIQGSLKGVSRKLQECFKEVSRKFQGHLKKLKGVFSLF